MADLQSFVSQYNGRAVDFDGAYGAQCVDLIQFYNRDVVGGGRFSGNAKDIFGQDGDKYDWVRNTPAGVPPAGAIVVYGPPVGGGYGDVCIALAGGNSSSFPGFGQNYPYGTGAHVTSRNYLGCIGWGVPKAQVGPAPAPSNGVVTVFRNVTITVPALNVRTEPNSSSPQAKNPTIPDGMLHQGQTISVTGWEHGENVGGNDVWLRTVNNNWVWAGGTNW